MLVFSGWLCLLWWVRSYLTNPDCPFSSSQLHLHCHHCPPHSPHCCLLPLTMIIGIILFSYILKDFDDLRIVVRGWADICVLGRINRIFFVSLNLFYADACQKQFGDDLINLCNDTSDLTKSSKVLPMYTKYLKKYVSLSAGSIIVANKCMQESEISPTETRGVYS